MADTTIDLLKNSSYVGKMDELIAAVKLGGSATSDVEWNNVKNKPTTIGGYGITDAKIDNGTITLGNQTISIPDKLPNPNALTFTGAATGSYDGSKPLTVNVPSLTVDDSLTKSGQAADAAVVGEQLSSLSGKMVQSVNNQKPDENGNVTVETGSGVGDITLGITGATVGQIAKITAVDDTGKPTAWEPVDMAGETGGASYWSWSKVWTLAVAEDIAGFTASNIDLDGKSEIMVVFISDSTASRTMVNGRILINGVDAGRVLFNTLALRKDSHTFVIIGRADEGIEYTTMAAKAEYQTYPWQGDVNVVHRMVSGTNTVTQWIADSTIEITQGSATLGKGVTIEIYVR